MFNRDVRRSGRWFPERGCILGHQIFSFAEMMLRDRCSTSYDLASLFSWQAQYFRQVEWKNRKAHWHEAVSSALLKEVSQNCFVFHVVSFEKWGNLAELFRFWCCQVQKLRKSRRIASFSSLQIDRWIDRHLQLQLQLQVPLHYTATTTTSTHILRYITQHYTTLITSNHTTLH